MLPVDGSARCGRKADALDTEIAELGQFAVVADAVVVGILPDHEVTERRILAVDHAVMVAVEARQRGDAIGEVAAIERRREQLVAAFDIAGAVDVEREDAVSAIGGPGDLVLGAVVVDVEGDTVFERAERDAVVIEVEDDGVGNTASNYT